MRAKAFWMRTSVRVSMEEVASSRISMGGRPVSYTHLAIVIVTGIVGALLAETVCKLFHITDPIAKDVGIGTAVLAVGTSKALQMGEVEGAMSGLSIALSLIHICLTLLNGLIE